MSFLESFNKELAKQSFKTMDAQELQDPEVNRWALQYFPDHIKTQEMNE